MNKKTVQLTTNCVVPSIGLGTWFLGDNPQTRTQELSALRAGIEAGVTLIDTAEMYGNGRSERLVGDAIRGYRRGDVFLVSKVLPSNAGTPRIFNSCNESLKRLGTDYLDLYLLHWRGSVPLEETVYCMERLKKEGKIRAWGVSNFDIDDMEELWNTPDGKNCKVNQVLYHMGSRGIEFRLLPWMRAHNVALMAYCPLAQGGTLRRGLFTNTTLRAIADHHNAAIEQILLAWCIRDGNTIAIPRSGNAKHVLLNVKSNDITLTDAELDLLDSAFLPPVRKTALDIQ